MLMGSGCPWGRAALGGFPRGCVCPRLSSLGKQRGVCMLSWALLPFHVPYLAEALGSLREADSRCNRCACRGRALHLLAARSTLCHCSSPAGRDALRARENEQSRVSTGILPLPKQLALHAAWNAVRGKQPEHSSLHNRWVIWNIWRWNMKTWL